MGKKQQSLGRYLVGWEIILTVLMVVAVILAVLFLERGATDSVLRGHLYRNLNALWKDIYLDNGTIQLGTEHKEEYDDLVFVVLDEDDSVLLGQYPDGVTWEMVQALDNRRDHFVDGAGVRYSFRRIKRHLGRQSGTDERELTIIGFMDYSNATSIYREISSGVILTVFVTGVLILVIQFMAMRGISRSLMEVTAHAERIGADKDFSTRLENHERFTELSALVDAQNRLLDRVEEMIEFQKVFNRNVSHELRTPVSVIRAQCEMLQQKYVNDPALTECLERIMRQNDRMKRLVQMLLIISRLEDGQSLFEDTDEIDLTEVITFLCADKEEIAGKKLFELELEEVAMQGNINLIVTLFDNLISNAVKYGQSDQLIRIQLYKEEGFAYAQVSDYGVGIAQREQRKIFDPFYQVDPVRSKDGFGLGLVMARRVTEHYDGKIYVRSEEGRGSTFFVSLRCFPLSTKQPAGENVNPV